MSYSREKLAQIQAEQRRKNIARGNAYLYARLPAALIEEIDALKEKRGQSSRTPLIEEALRFYIEQQRA